MNKEMSLDLDKQNVMDKNYIYGLDSISKIYAMRHKNFNGKWENYIIMY